MKLSDFILLNEEEKKIAVLHTGVLIGKRKDIDTVAFLFRVDNYYVEAFFNSGNKTIREFRMFNHTTLLQPYLDSIRIDDILN
jgi:hypothetical protein